MSETVDDGLVEDLENRAEHAEERITTLERQLAEAQAQAGAMTRVLKGYERWEADPILSEPAWAGGRVALPRLTQELAERNAALAPEAGKEALAWKESAMHVLAEWHEAREIIGGAQLGDGPIQWAKRVRASILEEAAKVADELADIEDGSLVGAAIRALAESTSPDVAK